jgi:hypothetical protein
MWSAEAGGFKKTQVSFTLGTGQTQGIDIHMSVASASTEIAVTTEAAALDVDENRIEGTLSAATVSSHCQRSAFGGEQGNLQFRFDFLNLLNRANLGAVDNNMAEVGAFGRVHSALSGRQIQLGARVSF